jgi:hypothetical protein
MDGAAAGGGSRGEGMRQRRGTQLSNCLLRAERAAYASGGDSAALVRLVYVEGRTVYFYLAQPGCADDALLERLRRGLRRELGFNPQLEQLFAG